MSIPGMFHSCNLFYDRRPLWRSCVCVCMQKLRKMWKLTRTSNKCCSLQRIWAMHLFMIEKGLSIIPSTATMAFSTRISPSLVPWGRDQPPWATSATSSSSPPLYVFPQILFTRAWYMSAIWRSVFCGKTRHTRKEDKYQLSNQGKVYQILGYLVRLVVVDYLCLAWNGRSIRVDFSCSGQRTNTVLDLVSCVTLPCTVVQRSNHR